MLQASAVFCNEYDSTTARKMASEIVKMADIPTKLRAKLAIEFGSSVFQQEENETE